MGDMREIYDAMKKSVTADIFGERFACITADPPWLERGGGVSKRGADRHYDLMSTDKIIETMRQAPEWRPADSAHLWVWVTDNFLEDGLRLIRELGFRYVRTLVWVKVSTPRAKPRQKRSAWGRRGLWLSPKAKVQVGLGQYLRGSHELVLFAVRGEARVPPTPRRRSSVIIAERGRHSAKPDEFFDIVESVSDGPRIEFFARTPRPGWSAFGNDPALKAGT